MAKRIVVAGIFGGIAGVVLGYVAGFFSLFLFIDGLIIAGQRVPPEVQIMTVAIAGGIVGLVLGGVYGASAGSDDSPSQ